MLYIIGVAHRVQARKQGADSTEAQTALTQSLERAIDLVRPAFIGEEACEETLECRQEISIVKEVADKHVIRHMFCDPSQEKRQAIGYRNLQSIEMELVMRDKRGLWSEEIRNKARAIEIGRYFGIREQFWLERLAGHLDLDGIFVCGDLHVENPSFRRLLEHNNIPCEVLERRIGVTKDDEPDYVALRYLEEHPDVIELVNEKPTHR